MLLMCLFSSFANIWTEYVYKKDDTENFYMKNIYLYSYGIFFNSMALYLLR